MVVEQNKEELKVKNNSQEIEILEDGITIKSIKKENHTIEELEQKVINYLYDLNYYDSDDVELLKSIFINKKRLDTEYI